MKRLLWVLLIAGCYDPYERPREEDPWEKYANQGVPPGNIRVKVDTFEFDGEDRTAFDSAYRYRDDNVVVAGGDLYSNNGLTLFAGTDRFLAAFRADSQRYRSRRTTSTFVLIADGEEGAIQVVERVPVPVVRVIPIYNGVVIVRTIEAVVVGTSLYARPRLRTDGLVDLELTPVVSHLENRSVLSIRVTELSTKLVVRPDRPYVIMAHQEKQDSFGSVFFSSRHQRSTRKVLQVLTVER